LVILLFDAEDSNVVSGEFKFYISTKSMH